MCLTQAEQHPKDRVGWTKFACFDMNQHNFLQRKLAAKRSFHNESGEGEKEKTSVEMQTTNTEPSWPEPRKEPHKKDCARDSLFDGKSKHDWVEPRKKRNKCETASLSRNIR